MENAGGETVKNTFIVILAVSMVSAIGGLVFNTMPLLLGAAGQAFGLSPAQLGTLSLTAGIGYLAGTLTGPLWVERVNWRLTAFGIVAAVIASFLLATQLSGTAIYAGFAIFGFFCALAIALAMRVLADMPDPERAYGTRLSVELISIGVFLILLPILFISRTGFSGAMLGLALFAALLGLGSLVFPKRSSSEIAAKLKGFPNWPQAGPSWSVLGIFTIYLLANVGLFFFLYVIAQDFNPTPAQNGLMFGVLKWLGGAAGAVGAIIGARAGLRVPHLAAFAILMMGVVGLFLSKSFTAYMISSWVWEFGFTLGCLYQTAAIVRFDISNKLVVLVPMAFGISMIFGGKIAGQILEGGSANGIYLMVAICSLLPAAYMVLGCGPQASTEIGTRPVEAHEAKRELPLPPFPNYPSPATKLTAESEGVIYYPIKSPYDFSRVLKGYDALTSDTGKGVLVLPEGARAETPVPAIVIMHGSGGIKEGREMDYAELFAANGIASLVIDYYAPRGVTEQTPYVMKTMIATEVDVMSDAYSALKILGTHPAIDATRIGVTGYSYGGMGTRYVLDDRLKNIMAPEVPPFALHMDIYGPCHQTLGVRSRATSLRGRGMPGRTQTR